MKKILKVFEAFAGIGAQHKALSNLQRLQSFKEEGALNRKFKIVGLAEWYVPAIIAYHAIHSNVKIIKNVSEEKMRLFLSSKTLSMDSKKPVQPKYWNKKSGKELQTIYSYIKFSENAGNIFDVHNMKDVKTKIDLLIYSFPCQDLSIQGKGKGIKTGTRSGLLFQIKEYIKNIKDEDLPDYLLMENVKALKNKNHWPGFLKWIKYLESRGYQTNTKTLNSQNFGSAQRRERVFAISSRKGMLELPEYNSRDPKVLKDILDLKFNEKYRLKKLEDYERGPWQDNKSSNNIKRLILKNYTTFASESYIYDKKHIGPTLTATGANSRLKFAQGKKIRMMNPREAYAYMGFTKDDCRKVEKTNVVKPTQIIFTAGNSISVEVLEEIFKVVIG